MTKHLLSIDDLSRGDIIALVERAIAIKHEPEEFADLLRGRTLLMLFAKPSMRTRVSFEAAMTQLGGHAIAYDVAHSTRGEKETLADFGAVASRYAQAIVARLYAQREIEELASRATVPVINGLTDHEHPCQALGDLVTMSQKRPLLGATLTYVGDAHNNVTHSLMLAAAKVGMDMRIACPPEMQPDDSVLARARAIAGTSGARIWVTHDPIPAVREADFVYTDTWMSYHVASEERERRAQLLEPYRVDEALMAEAPYAWFMHCLPATRGEEVTDAVLDSPASIVLDQAEDRLHAQKALLLALMHPPMRHAVPPYPMEGAP